MNNYISKILKTAVLTAILYLCVFSLNSFAAERYIYDNANLINDSEELKIKEIGEKVYNDTKTKITIYTVDNLGSMEEAQAKVDITLDLLRLRDPNGYVVLFVDKQKILSNERGKLFIANSSKFDNVVNKQIFGDIATNNVFPMFKVKQYSEGCFNYYTSIAAQIDKFYGISNEYDKIILKPKAKVIINMDGEWKKLILIWVGVFILLLLLTQVSSDELIDSKIINYQFNNQKSTIYEYPFIVRPKNKGFLIFTLILFTFFCILFTLISIKSAPTRDDILGMSITLSLFILVFGLILISIYGLRIELYNDKIVITKLWIRKKEILICDIVKKINVHKISTGRGSTLVIAIFAKHEAKPIKIPIEVFNSSEIAQFIHNVNSKITESEDVGTRNKNKIGIFQVILLGFISLILSFLMVNFYS